MDVVGIGKRVRIYVGESDQWRHRPLYLAILDLLRAEGCAGATVVRGIAGFGAHSRIHTASLVDLAPDLPLVIEWIDAPERVARVLPKVRAMVAEGMITREDVEIVHYQQRAVSDIGNELRAREVMTTDVAAVPPSMPLPEAVRLLVGKDYRALPVVDEAGRVMGIVTNGDLVERGGLRVRLELLGVLSADQLAAELAALEAGKTVGDVMTRPAVTIGPDAKLADVAHLMVARSLKRVPVVGPGGQLLGIVSRADLLRTRTDAFPRATDEAVAPGGRTIGDVMRADVPVVSRTAELSAVLDAVVSTRLNRAIVVDEARRVVGIVSDAELLRRLSPEDHPGVLRVLMRRVPFVHHRGDLADPTAKTAEQLMAPDPLTVPADTPLGEAIELMVTHRRKVLPVVDAEGRLLGAADRADLLRALVTREGGATNR